MDNEQCRNASIFTSASPSSVRRPSGRKRSSPAEATTASPPASPNLSEHETQILRKKIQKVSRACDYCKAKKLKCTGMQPCAGCTKRKLSCFYNAAYRRGRPPTPLGATPEITEAASGTAASGAELEVESGSASRESSVAIPLDGHLAADPAGFEGQYSDQTSGLSFLHRAWKRVSAAGDQPPQPAPDTSSQYQSIFTTGDSPYPTASLPHELHVPDHETAVTMLNFYFDTCVTTYRFMHQPSLQSWLTTVVINFHSGLPLYHGIGHAKASAVLTILAIVTLRQHRIADVGARVSSYSLSDIYFLAASDLTATEVGYPTLESAQARLLQVLYLLQSTRMNQAWFVFGATLPIVTALGLHRRTKHSSSTSSSVPNTSYILTQSRRRTFWTFFTIDKYLAVVFGRPPVYHPDETDQDFPDRINDEDMTPSGPSIASTNEPTMECHIDSLIFHARLAQLIDATSRQVYSIRQIPQAHRLAAARNFAAALRTWKAELPHHLGSVRPLSLIPPFRRQALALKLAYCHAIMHANRPFLLAREKKTKQKKQNDSSLMADSVEECINAARMTLETVDSLSTDPDKSFFYSLWWTPYVTFCALAIIYVWQIQAQRGPLVSFSSSLSGLASRQIKDSQPNLLHLADRCRNHLADEAAANTPSRRYNIILDELCKEAKRYGGGNNRPSDSSGQESAAAAAAPAATDANANTNTRVQGTQANGAETAGFADYWQQVHVDGASMLDEWQMSDWLELDSSAFGPFPSFEAVNMPWMDN